MEDFVKKHHLMDGMIQFMNEMRIGFLGIMFAYLDEDRNLHRQLALCSVASFAMDALTMGLLTEKYVPEYPSLRLLENTSIHVIIPKAPGISMRFFDQNNVEPSRKQIGPILQQFFDSQLAQ
jgi:hypothetical protein